MVLILLAVGAIVLIPMLASPKPVEDPFAQPDFTDENTTAPSDPSTGTPSPSPEPSTGTGTGSKADLLVGDCIADVEALRAGTAGGPIDCETPHQGQVYANEPITDTSYPGESVITERAKELCSTEASSALDSSVMNGEYSPYFVGPSEQTWSMPGEKQIVCLIVRVDGGDITGSKIKTQ
ncbi:septum formation family protein [Saxibacter everestensis]|uniref:Septum formation family protein n=1 Tax=Saxibacter everestensis TaxID=2909229 RepID=A0ABY8QTC1_9MICO|nr:septum formation family protein [Brevibacteriaceae bacterium ZFBP1038]